MFVITVLILFGSMPQTAYGLTYEQTTVAHPRRIWDYLYSQIGNAYGVAGIMGNMYTESGLRPNNLDNVANDVFGMSDEAYTNAVDNGTYTGFNTDGSYYGLNQWGGVRKQKMLAYAKSIDASIGSLEAQLGFVMQELNTAYFSGLLKYMKNATSVREASDEWLRVFGGVPDKPEESRAYRAARGQEFFDAYAPADAGATEDPEEPTDEQIQDSEQSSEASEGGNDSSQEAQDTQDSQEGQDTQGGQSGQDSQGPQETETETQPVVLSSDSSLKSLKVSEEGLLPAFSSRVSNYSLSVGNYITSVKISAAANDAKAKVSVKGGTDLSEGRNTAVITVTAENGSTSVYRIYIIRREEGSAYESDPEFMGSQEFIGEAAAEEPPEEAEAEPAEEEVVLPEVKPEDIALIKFTLPLPLYLLAAIIVSVILFILFVAL